MYKYIYIYKYIMEYIGLSTFIPIVATISKDFAIKSLTTSMKSIMTLSNCIIGNDKQYFSQIKNDIDTIDINNSVNIIYENVLEYSESENLSNSIKSAIMGVNDILSKIESELKIIRNAMIHHESKYFNKWRNFNCDINILTIKKHEHILQKRFKLLKDTIILNTCKKITN